MFPKSELYETAESSITAVNDRKIFVAGNEIQEQEARANDNFLKFVGCFFPLFECSSLDADNQTYADKAREEFNLSKEKYIRLITENRGLVSDEISKNDFLSFYFTVVLNYYREDVKRRFAYSNADAGAVKKKREQTRLRDLSDIDITADILKPYGGGILLFDRRLFPLQKVSIETDPLVVIDKTGYGIREAALTLDELEIRFQEALEYHVKKSSIEEILRTTEQRQELSDMEKELLMNIEKVEEMRKDKFSYEFGSIGLDIANNYIYWLHDSKTNRSQAMGTAVARTKGRVFFSRPITRSPMARKSPDEKFSIGEQPCIKIGVPSPDDLKGVINYLRACALTHYTS